MIRARPGRRIPRSFPPILVLLMLCIVLGACAPTNVATATPPAGTGTQSPTASGSGTPLPSAASSSTPGSTDSPGPSSGPSASGPLPTGGSAACSGSDANRAFYAQATAAMTWSVYCPVLPDGWFVQSGSYRLADGGHLDITYRGPGGAQISLAEGNICAAAGTDVDACVPRDSVIGPAAMGDQAGELGRLSAGLVLDVDRGANPSWRVTGFGFTEDDFRAICAAMVLVTP